MAVLGAAPADAAAAMSAAGLALDIAAINTPSALTVAGPDEDLAALADIAGTRRWSFVPLDLDYAFHTAAMEPVREGLLQDLTALAPAAGRCPFISTVEGGPVAG